MSKDTIILNKLITANIYLRLQKKRGQGWSLITIIQTGRKHNWCDEKIKKSYRESELIDFDVIYVQLYTLFAEHYQESWSWKKNAKMFQFEVWIRCIYLRITSELYIPYIDLNCIRKFEFNGLFSHRTCCIKIIHNHRRN